MNAKELKKLLKDGALEKYSALYASVEDTTERFILAIDAFTDRFGEDRDISLFSVPGRSEICGNHTDHNGGSVLAGAISRDIIAVASKNDDGVVRFKSEGFSEDTVDLAFADTPGNFENYSSASLIAGVADGFVKRGYSIGGYDAYSNTEVLKGSGISSSAAYEVMLGNIQNHFYNDGSIDNKEIAVIAQYAENVFFGKPSGLMDQMACAVGGFVYIDFKDKINPIVEPVNALPSDYGYALCLVNTGGNHADLNDDYASVPAEMRAVAALLGKEILSGCTESEIVSAIPVARETVGDRAVMRALHFVRECARVEKAKSALKSGDFNTFLDTLTESGRSSFEYLQNVYTNLNVKEQGLSLALALADGYLSGKRASYRVHGGGFAGTIQVFLPVSELDGFCEYMDKVFGKGASLPLFIRPEGACKLL